MKKIAFFDIDGTLVSFHTHRVSEAVLYHRVPSLRYEKPEQTET